MKNSPNAFDSNLVRKVQEGEISFKELAKSQEEEFYRLVNQGKNMKREDAKKWLEGYQHFTATLYRIRPREDAEQFLEDTMLFDNYKAAEQKSKEGQGYYYGLLFGALFGAGFTLGGFLSGGLILFVAGAFLSSSVLVDMGLREKKMEKKLCSLSEFRGEIKKKFSDLEGIAAKADKLVRAPILFGIYQKSALEASPERYKKMVGIFKETFVALDHEEQNALLAKIFDSPAKNEKINAWLSENYPKLVSDIGRDAICAKTA